MHNGIYIMCARIYMYACMYMVYIQRYFGHVHVAHVKALDMREASEGGKREWRRLENCIEH